MTWNSYVTFVIFATVLVIAPGPDFAVVLKNSLAGGSRSGLLTSLGVVNSNVVQGTVAAFGLGAVIVRSQMLFDAIRWAGVAYLCYLGLQALRSARKGQYGTQDERLGEHKAAFRGWRQGFLSNITNPKVLVFYLSILPQFLHPGQSSLWIALALAYTHAILALIWLVIVVALLDRIRTWVSRRRVRRTLDAVTGTALVGFGIRLAAET